MPSDAEPLPQQAGNQYRWEGQTHQLAGNQDDTESDDHKTDEQQRGVDNKRTPYLTATDSQQQRYQDDGQQPQVFYQQPRGHDHEVLVAVVLYQSHHNGQGDGGSSPHDRPPLLQELRRVESFRHEPEDEQVEADGQDGVEGNGDKQTKDPEHVPVGMLGGLVGRILPGHDLFHVLPLLLEVP